MNVHSVKISVIASSVVLACVMISACSSPTRTAPVVDRTTARPKTATPSNSAVASTRTTSSAPELAANATYVVKAGDTLYSIALAHGHDARDLAAWNRLENPTSIRVGQTLQVSPPDGASANSSAPQTSAVVSSGAVESRALGSALPPLAKADPKPTETKRTEIKPAEIKPAETKSMARSNDAEISWIWPANGVVLDGFDETKNKGINIAAKGGDAVVAAADGKVVYAGSGLRGYGNLVIVKHTDSFISAYAHNSKLLVATDAQVRRGQKIAEAGSTDADRPKLHFEIRRQGKPVDPLKYLPDKSQ